MEQVESGAGPGPWADPSPGTVLSMLLGSKDWVGWGVGALPPAHLPQPTGDLALGLPPPQAVDLRTLSGYLSSYCGATGFEGPGTQTPAFWKPK